MTEQEAQKEADRRLAAGEWGAVAVESPPHSGHWIVDTKGLESGFPDHGTRHAPTKAKGSVTHDSTR